MPIENNDDVVTLTLPRSAAEPVRNMMRNHISELPSNIRPDVQAQLSNWGPSGRTQGGDQGGGQQTTR